MRQLCISLPKFFMPHMGIKNPSHIYHFNGTVVTAVDNIKDLRVHIMSNLSWLKQVRVCKKS